MKQLKYHGKQFVESNGIIKDAVPLEQQNKILNLLKKNLINFRI